MRLYRYLMLVLLLTIPGWTQSPATQPSFEELLRKWERHKEVGNFLLANARLSYPELIQAHPKYSEESRNNMLALAKNTTIIFLWLKNTGTENISGAFAKIWLENEKGDKLALTNYYPIDGEPIAENFEIPPGKERTITLHFPKQPDPLKRARLILEGFRYSFVTFNAELLWDFNPAPPPASAPVPPTPAPTPEKAALSPEGKARLEKLKTDVQRLKTQQNEINAAINALEKEIATLEK